VTDIPVSPVAGATRPARQVHGAGGHRTLAPFMPGSAADYPYSDPLGSADQRAPRDDRSDQTATHSR
jgi:hypothetical protein